jgi:hypothetical protein
MLTAPYGHHGEFDAADVARHYRSRLERSDAADGAAQQTDLVVFSSRSAR